MVKNMAENVVHSLQTLLMILLNQVATQVSSQEVPMEQATMMNQLMNEVQSQKEKIEELADLMKNQALSPSRRDEAFTLLTESDLEVWDQEVRVYQQPQAAKASPVTHGVSTTPMTSPPTRGRSTAAGKGSFLAPQTKGRVVGTATMLERTAPRDTTTWEPIKWSRANGQSAQPEPRLDNHGNGAVGNEACDLGKETPWENIPGSLRTRQPVCELVFKPHQFTGRSDRRFRSLLPNTATDGAAAAPEPGVDLGKEGSWDTLISDSQIIVETAFEAKLIQAAKSAEIGKAFGKPIDLLEVYAQPNSRLAEEVRKQRGRSERFTKEHGDLATFQGQLQLIRMIFRLRPKHIWVAPECFPWCAWNRFNAGKKYLLVREDSKES